jgi:hypothetical protein
MTARGFPIQVWGGPLLVLISAALAQPTLAAERNKPQYILKLWQKNHSLPLTTVRKTLGKPRRVSRQFLYRKVIEQWIYEYPQGRLIVEVEFARGSKARVQSVHLLRRGKP